MQDDQQEPEESLKSKEIKPTVETLIERRFRELRQIIDDIRKIQEDKLQQVIDEQKNKEELIQQKNEQKQQEIQETIRNQDARIQETLNEVKTEARELDEQQIQNILQRIAIIAQQLSSRASPKQELKDMLEQFMLNRLLIRRKYPIEIAYSKAEELIGIAHGDVSSDLARDEQLRLELDALTEIIKSDT